ncbi:glycosyltransferase [Actinosynnema sp. NPDC047251]|uniref:Glycosyltransferase, family 4 n=1 Tax=Saccharothrix espanaensis (strain ATCC 51144 / DSM 44229 / JCM 9112 / NBRC 15066 / NRRL 15764) TaxID=1179773 RepID=K0K4I8_SACES|nr:glycosyltransferase [Saccharothrix espanaensis]CCH33206.1 Glycosyltransferase, family 4 [Saccharothrix espanaensis DSM 44229]
MKIVHVTQPVEAGVAAVVLELAVAQRETGWEVDVVCPPGWLADRLRDVRIPVHDWPAGRSPGPGTVSETARLRRILAVLDPDAVHLHSSKAGLAGRLAVRGTRPTIFQPHLWSFQTARGLLRRACAAWERYAARWTDQLVCVSDDELTAGRDLGVDTAAEVVCNGVDTTVLRPRSRVAARMRLGLPDLPTAVCVGRIAPLKGQDQLLKAWPAVLERVPDARLVLVGDGPMRDRWQASGDHPSVRWWGHDTAVADFYTAADVVVLPSRAEGMALVPLEAMASGRTVVAFDVGGVRQSVGEAGAVVPAGDVPALAEAVAARLADPVLAADEGLTGRRRAEVLFDSARVSDQIATLVEKLVGGNR